MARADLLVNLVRAGSQSDRTLLRRTVEALAAEERARQHHVLADRLLEQLSMNGASSASPLPRLHDRARAYFTEISPRLALDSLILSEQTRSVVKELTEEHHRADLLRSYNLEPRHRVLLAGPPGNGKTSLAEAIAESLMTPLIVVRYDAVIGSFLGETANRLSALFDQVRSRRCVLFFDEFDVLGKERGDIHETGEIKRVVSSLLLQVDDLPSYAVVIAATNHPELLDRAVWRRFQVRLELGFPTRQQTEEWIGRFEERIGVSLGTPRRTLVMKLKGLSFSDLEGFGADVYRRYVLDLPSSDMKQIVQSRLDQLTNRYEVAASHEDETHGGD